MLCAKSGNLSPGRKRSRCDHHDISLWNDLRAVWATSDSDSDGLCFGAKLL